MMLNSGERDGFLLVGILGKARGLKGHVRVRPLTDDPERFYDLERVYFKQDGKYTPVEIAEADVNGESVYVKLEGYDDRTAAEGLTGRELYISREDAVELEPGAYFVADLIGCSVYDENGKFVGKLSDVLQMGPTDVYVLRGGPRAEVMFPALKAVITETDIVARRITVDSKRLDEVAVFES